MALDKTLEVLKVISYDCVTVTAESLDFLDLAALTRDEYILILKNFSALMKHYDIRQDGA